MEKPYLPQRIFYSLAEIEQRWGISNAELWQWLMHGTLHGSVWLPLVSANEIIEKQVGAHRITSRRLQHFEGYAALMPYHYRNLFRRGQTSLREFTNSETGVRYALPETSEDIDLGVSELVILQKECLRFEETHRLVPGKFPDVVPSWFDPSFKRLRYAGSEFRFGDIQAAVLRQLYEFAGQGTPWQNGKQILARAGSESFTLSNVFKRHPAWRQQVIVSDGRGSYRLHENLLSSIEGERERTDN